MPGVSSTPRRSSGTASDHSVPITTAETFDLTPVALRGPPRTPVASGEHRLAGPVTRLGCGRAVLEAFGRAGGGHAFLDQLLDHVDQNPVAATGDHNVTDVDPGGRFRCDVVDSHMPVVARARGLGAGLERSHRPQPLVHAYGHTRVWQYGGVSDTTPGKHRINDPKWPTRITIACANFSTEPRDKSGSVDKLINVSEEAAAAGADLVVFPELAINTWGSCPECTAQNESCEWHLAEAETASGPSAQRIAEAAARLGVHVIYGFEETGDRPGIVHNSANLIGPDGLIGTYRKLHLGIPLETNRFTPGNALPVFDTELGPIGISICYDFYNNPELSRLLCFKGARLLVNPTGRSDLPHARENLTQATLVRAQENLVFAASSNRVGNTHGEPTWAGGSVIGGPDFPGFGVALATADAGEELIVAEVDFDNAARWHDWLPWTEWRLEEQRPITDLVQREFAALLDGGQ